MNPKVKKLWVKALRSGKYVKCKSCKKIKLRSNFWKHIQKKNGLQSYCKNCKKQLWRQYTSNPINRRKVRDNHCRWYENGGKLIVRRNRLRWQKKNRSWRFVPKEKRIAYTILRTSIRNGSISKPLVCSNCGKISKIEGHHYDYSKPLDVLWLCNPCHRNVHDKLKIEEQL